jgi:hypothetical protein
MFESAKIINKGRRIIFQFDGELLTGAEYEERDDVVWHNRIKVEFSHNATMKRYEATVWRCAAASQNASGFTTERFTVFGGNNATIASEPVGRFSDSGLARFQHRAMDLCKEIIADQNNVSLAAELLREAQSCASVAS